MLRQCPDASPIRRPALSAAVALLLGGCASSRLEEPLVSAAPVKSKAFRQSLHSLISPGFVDGNRIDILNNGDEIFPAMLAAIRSARETINFETYIYYRDNVPQEFAAALTERARAGVEVRLLLDAVGAAKARTLRPSMTDAGVKIELYHPVLWPDLRRANYRTHRKLLIVDGRVGFTGGVGIGDVWAGDARNPDEWHDLHFRARGPVVAQLQAAFVENWRESTDEVLHGAKFFPPLAPTGPELARVFTSSPHQARSTVELSFHLAIAAARRSLLIENAYFLPDRALLEAITTAAQRGVKVQIIMPGHHMDQPAVRRASRKRWATLLTAGVELYEYQPTMTHTKLLIADGEYVSVGSSNFDPRSLRINDEANLEILDARFARRATAIFREDLRRCRRVTDAGHSIRTIHTVPISLLQTPLEGQL